MGGITAEARKELEVLRTKNNTSKIELIHLADLFENYFKVSKGAKLFSEQSKQLPFESNLHKQKNFAKKISLIGEQLEIIKAYFKTYEMSQKTLLSPNKSKQKGSKEKSFENAARDYYLQLKLLNKVLFSLISDRLNKKHTFSTPNINDDIESLKQTINFLNTSVNEFKLSLEDTQKQIIENSMSHNPSSDGLTALNFQVAINHIDQQYHEAYDKAYGATGFWRKIKNFFKKGERFQEIQFLKNISDHPNSNDSIRYQAMVLLHNKIIDSEFFGANSKLRKILQHITQSEIRTNKKSVDDLEDLNEFLIENENIDMPKGLKSYFQKHENEYTVDNLTIISQS